MFFDLLCTITSLKKRLQSTCCGIFDIPIIPDRTNSVTAQGSINNKGKKIEQGGIDRSEISLKIVQKTQRNYLTRTVTFCIHLS